jgi:hypothetical protein
MELAFLVTPGLHYFVLNEANNLVAGGSQVPSFFLLLSFFVFFLSVFLASSGHLSALFSLGLSDWFGHSSFAA